MKVLFDTNILIYSEDFAEIPINLQKLLKIFKKNGVSLYVHPSSMIDIENDRDEKRKKVMSSKFNSYPCIEDAPKPDAGFIGVIGAPKSSNGEVDSEILYALYKDCVNFLLTEDREIIKLASKINLKDRVFTIESALEYFEELYERKYPKHLQVKKEQVYNIDIADLFFDSLKKEYHEFAEWFKKISGEQRPCYVYRENGGIKALLILKVEDESIETNQGVVPANTRLKICTFKVERFGLKMGELLLKISFEFCIKNNIDEAYLTHFTNGGDYLTDLIADFGFRKMGKNKRGEEVYLKKFICDDANLTPLQISKKYYPSYKDSEGIRKFIIPILPKFHDRLFPEYSGRQSRITDFGDMTEFSIPGNTIKKAYLSHSPIRKIREGDIVIFYRSWDKQLTALGVVENAIATSKIEDIIITIEKRSVYSMEDLKEMAKKPVLCILFMHHFYLENPIDYKNLKKEGIISSGPQSIIEISHEKYTKIKELGGLNERFIVD
jgi:hypothetical protein